MPGLIGPSSLAIAGEREQTLPRSEYVARTIGRLLAAGLEQCRQHGGLAVHYDELPGAVTGRLASLLALDPSENATVLAGAAHHSKRPDELFEPDRPDKPPAVDDATRLQVEQWAMQPYVALEALRNAQRSMVTQAP